MNVSITEDATMSRTRFERGATVVRVDAIALAPARRPAIWVKGGETLDTPRDKFISE
jgi:hypothetical protein